MAARLNFPMEALTSRLNFGGRFDSVRSTSLSTRFSNLKPLSEFLDVKRISKPANFSEAQNRVNFNLSYFSSNYMMVFVMLAIYTLLTNWLLFFDILLVIGGMWGIGRLEGRDLDLGFVRATVSQLYTALICIAVPLGFIANPLGAALWLIGASGVSILGHAAFMDKPIEPFERLSDYDPASLRKRRKFGKRGAHLDDSGDEAVRFSTLDPAYLLQGAGDYANLVGDQLEFTGYDLASARRSGGQEMLADDVSVADYEEEWEVERQRYATYLRAMKERDKSLVKSANDKMKRAREKGKSRASLSQDEIEALERRRLQEKQEKGKKSSRSSSDKTSRSSSAANLTVDKTRRKSSTSRIFSSPAANSSRTRVPKSSSPKTSRRTSSDASTFPTAPAGFLVQGPDGQPVYAPLPYYPPQPAYRSSDSRSGSSSSRHNPPPVSYDGGYIPYSPRYYTPPHGQDYARPPSSSRRSPTDELHMPQSRPRASSSANLPDPYRSSPSGSSSRRNVSGPADVSYSRLRHMQLMTPTSEFPPGDLPDEIMDRGEDSGSGESVVIVNEESDSGSEEGGAEAGGSRDRRSSQRIERVPVGGRKERDRDRERERKSRRKR